MVHPFWGNAVVQQDIDNVLHAQVGNPVGIYSGPVESKGRPSLGTERVSWVEAVIFPDGFTVSPR